MYLNVPVADMAIPAAEANVLNIGDGCCVCPPASKISQTHTSAVTSEQLARRDQFTKLCALHAMLGRTCGMALHRQAGLCQL